MVLMNLLKTTTGAESPLDASAGNKTGRTVSDFLTIQSLANFSAMTGAILAAWNALKLLDANLFSAIWVPFAFALFFGIVSLLISLDGLKKANSSKMDVGSVAGAIFIAVINALVLASAVVGASVASNPAR